MVDNSSLLTQEQQGLVAKPSSAPVVSESIVEQAREERIKMESLLKEIKEERIKSEQAAAKLILGGRAEAGQPAPEKKEETPKEYKDRIMRGG